MKWTLNIELMSIIVSMEDIYSDIKIAEALNKLLKTLNKGIKFIEPSNKFISDVKIKNT